MTLLIPGFNDSDDELERLTTFLAGVSPLIPWHVTAFHQDYRMHDPANTTAAMLRRAAAIAAANGLRYVYAGNLPGQVGDLENTRCHGCGALLVERDGYAVQAYHLLPDGTCPSCRTVIPGRWGTGLRRADHVDAVRHGNPSFENSVRHGAGDAPARRDCSARGSTTLATEGPSPGPP